MLLLVWLLEQAVWIAPPLALALYLRIPKEDRGFGIATATWAMGLLFVTNVAGMYPGPARVSCIFGAGPVTCIERTADALAPAGSVGSGVHTTGTDSRTGVVVASGFGGRTDPHGSAEVELHLSPPMNGGGSLRAGAACGGRAQPRPIQAGAGIVSRGLPRTPADATGTTGTSTIRGVRRTSTTPPQCGAQQ